MLLSFLRAYLRTLILRTRVSSEEARSQEKKGKCLTECLPQEPDFEDQGDLCRGQAKKNQSDG